MLEFYIYFEGIINLQNAKKIIDALNDANEAGAKKVAIFFSSWGGNIDNGFLLASVIQNSPIPVSIHATNHIDSIANVIYLSAKSRTSESYAKFYMHGASENRGSNYDEKALKEALSSTKTSNTRIAYFISENSALKLNEVLALMEEGITLSAQEALNKGIVKEILHKEIPPNVARKNIIEIDLAA